MPLLPLQVSALYTGLIVACASTAAKWGEILLQRVVKSTFRRKSSLVSHLEACFSGAVASSILLVQVLHWR